MALLIVVLGTSACFAWGTSLPAFITTEQLASQLRLRHHLEEYTGRAVLSDDKNRVVVYPGRYSAVVNGDIVVMESMARVEGGKLMVPRTFLQQIEADLHRGCAGLRPVRPVRVVIDPGHGGKDPGTNRGGVREKDIVLDVGQRVTSMLRKRGMQVIMTRTRDVFVPLQERANIANRYGANVFVSIHVNATQGATSASGVEAFCVSTKYDPVRWGCAAANRPNLPAVLSDTQVPLAANDRCLLCAALFEDYVRQSRDLSVEIVRAVSRTAHVDSRGVKNDQDLHVIRGTQCARTLVEIGFISNASDRRRLMQSMHRERVAEGIVEGILRFVRKRERWSR